MNRPVVCAMLADAIENVNEWRFHFRAGFRASRAALCSVPLPKLRVQESASIMIACPNNGSSTPTSKYCHVRQCMHCKLIEISAAGTAVRRCSSQAWQSVRTQKPPNHLRLFREVHRVEPAQWREPAMINPQQQNGGVSCVDLPVPLSSRVGNHRQSRDIRLRVE